MEAVAASSGASPVLAYDIQQQRWERGVLWLTVIVCVSQAITLPLDLLVSLWMIREIQSAHVPLAHVLRMPWGAGILLEIVRQIVAFALVGCSILLLTRRPLARAAVIVVAWLLLALFAAQILCSYWFMGSLYGTYGDMRQILESLSFLLACAYTLILLPLVLMRRDGKPRPWSAATIWWLTAAAAMLMAVPTLLPWLTRFERMWNYQAVSVFAIFLERDPWQSLVGIGSLAGAMASLSAFAAVGWTLYRGKSGRWALMVCAALWVVAAVGVYGTHLARDLWHWRFAYWPRNLWEAASHVRDYAPEGRRLACFLAFPLAMRVALTLSDVRARLEGKAK